MRIALAEDSTLLREGLVRLLAEEGHEITAAVGDADALLAAVAADRPDLVLLDVRMPPTHTDEGMRAALDVRRRWPAVAVLVLSQHVERRHATELLTSSAGGVGYLLKDRVAHVGDFLDAMARVGSGGTAFDPELVRQLLTRGSRTDALAALSERERAVLDLVAQGHTNAAVAERLHVSRSAVEKHVNAIFDKLRIPAEDGYSRRVLAVTRYLQA